VGVVQVLSVAVTWLDRNTVAMAGNARTTAFVTGSDGFLGTELVKLLVARDHRVVALTRSVEAAETMRRIGAVPVIGDLRTTGGWQDEAAADWVFHLAPTPGDRAGTFLKRAATMARARLSLDANLLDAAAAGLTRRVVYVADPRSYGAAGSRPVTEDEPPRPSPSGRWLVPALDRLEGYVLAGLPIVTAIPGCIYGNGSWFRELVIEPVMRERRVLRFGKTGPLVSPIHVHDCARAIVHVAAHGEIGGRYFLANSEPVRTGEFAKTFARLAHRPLRDWRLPAAAARFLVGPARAEYPQADAVLSNIRLRAIGFRFEFPTLEHGVGQVLRAFHE
jgi:nucleoside-diphosphate-sugar epimerase